MIKQGWGIAAWVLVFITAALVAACGGGGNSNGGGSTATAPAVPSSVVAACGNNKITVSWAAVWGATSYHVYRSTVPGTAGTLLASPTANSWVDTTGTVGTTYYYTVTAVNSAGASAASLAASETFYRVLAGAMQGKALALATSVTTFAGSSGFSGTPVNGAVGANARFNMPQGMTTDGTYLYVADYLNNAIQRIDPATRAVTLFAGSPTGAGGYANGVGTAALFFRPYDITNDGTSLFVTEFNGCMIRKIDIATATVSTFAGQSAVCSPSTNGTGAAAIFANPQGITTDGTSLFVTENTVVRRINIATQAVTTFAGSGAVGHTDALGTLASFNNLEGITTDGTSLFVVDYYYQDIRQINIATASVTSLAGNYTNVTTTTSTDGTGIGATFNLPSGITSDGNNLYVVEKSSGVVGGGDVVRKVAIAGGGVTTLAGTAGVPGTTDGTGTAARFSSPWGITTYCGKLFIGDTGNSSIRQIR